MIRGILLSLLLTGCATICPDPYAKLGVGYMMGISDSDMLSNEAGSDPRGIYGAGCEYKNGWSIGYEHHSSVFRGKPFNSRPEYYWDMIEIEKKWGGRNAD